jgi:hypothetical protein
MVMKKRPAIPHRLIMVEWEDSSQPIAAWQWADDYQAPETVRCVSVGYLIAETEQAIAVAPNIGDVGCERIQASGIIRIPRSAVSKMSDLN